MGGGDRNGSSGNGRAGVRLTIAPRPLGQQPRTSKHVAQQVGAKTSAGNKLWCELLSARLSFDGTPCTHCLYLHQVFRQGQTGGVIKMTVSPMARCELLPARPAASRCSRRGGRASALGAQPQQVIATSVAQMTDLCSPPVRAPSHPPLQLTVHCPFAACSPGSSRGSLCSNYRLPSMAMAPFTWVVADPPPRCSSGCWPASGWRSFSSGSGAPPKEMTAQREQKDATQAECSTGLPPSLRVPAPPSQPRPAAAQVQRAGRRAAGGGCDLQRLGQGLE